MMTIQQKYNVSDHEKFKIEVMEILEDIHEMLAAKNAKYGNSALDPIGVFGSGDPEDLIDVRIDDKLSRIQNNQVGEDEDVVQDLIGYLILKTLARKRKAAKC